MENLFKSYTLEQAMESLSACREMLLSIYNKGNVPFDNDDANVINQSISTLYVLMNDTINELQVTPIFCALVKAQTKLHTQKIKSETNFFDTEDHKVDLAEAITFVEEAIDQLK